MDGVMGANLNPFALSLSKGSTEPKAKYLHCVQGRASTSSARTVWDAIND